jgi:hypothetical protein
MQIIVTDLTRFSNKDLLCMAGVTADGQTCIRPLRSGRPSYLTYQECKEKGLLPGAILDGAFTVVQQATAPHVEDNIFSALRIIGRCTSAQFEDVLEKSSVKTFKDGFGVPVQDKVLAVAPNCSIITLNIEPHQLTIVSGYNGEGIKANVSDAAGLSLRYLSITDLGFFDYVGNKATRRANVDEVNEFISSQDKLYLRVGLSRSYQAPDGRTGYWLQLNGIYTFPDYQKIIRQY